MGLRETMDRPSSRTARASLLDVLGYAVIAIGFVLLTLGILEIGGLFNVTLGLSLVMGGCVAMFAGTRDDEADAEEAFRRQLEEL
jgi:predicted phage tail protein